MFVCMLATLENLSILLCMRWTDNRWATEKRVVQWCSPRLWILTIKPCIFPSHPGRLNNHLAKSHAGSALCILNCLTYRLFQPNSYWYGRTCKHKATNNIFQRVYTASHWGRKKKHSHRCTVSLTPPHTCMHTHTHRPAHIDLKKHTHAKALLNKA